MHKLNRVAPYVCSVLLITFLNLLLASASQGSQLRPTYEAPKRLSELDRNSATKILRIVHTASKFGKLQVHLQREGYAIQSHPENQYYYKHGKFSAVSLEIESLSALTSEERVNQNEIVPMMITCILDEDAEKMIDYFVSRVSVRDGVIFQIEMKSDSLGLAIKYDIVPGPRIENRILDASDFMGKNLGIIKLGLSDFDDQDTFYGFLDRAEPRESIFLLSEAKACEEFNWDVFWECVLMCSGALAEPALIYCGALCIIPTWVCAFCIVAFLAADAACIWGCYEALS